MMEQYFALKYYEEVAGYVIMAVILAGCIIIPFGCAIVSKFKEWWNGDK